ncbi:MAG TPA: TetR/AcrR family transcriptional regulator [Polyangiaceae bacterium]
MSKGPRKPRPKPSDTYHHGDLRQALVEAALHAIERQGMAEVSLRAVARSLGVSPRAPYRHFATKEQLLAAVAVEGFRMSAKFTASRLEAAVDPMARLRAAVEAYVLFAAKHPPAFRVMYAPYAAVEESVSDLVRARAEGHAAMMQLISAAQATGQVRTGDPLQIGLAIWSTMHGLAVLIVEGQLGRFDRPADATKLAKLVADLLFEGLLVRSVLC